MSAAIVLAAGLGRRLAGATSLPKWLTPVGGTCPATVQLRGLTSCGIETVYVVVGDEPTKIEAHLEPWRDRLSIELVHNPHSTTRNNWYSMVIGLRRVLAEQHEEILLLNSDLFASPSWFRTSLEAASSTGHSAAVAVDPTRGRTDEAMKVALDPTGDRISGIGKTGVESPAGEYVGLAWWRREPAAELLAHLEGFENEPERVDNWYEHGIQVHIERGASYGAAPVASPDWVEIDDPADLAAARRLDVDPDS